MSQNNAKTKIILLCTTAVSTTMLVMNPIDEEFDNKLFTSTILRSAKKIVTISPRAGKLSLRRKKQQEPCKETDAPRVSRSLPHLGSAPSLGQNFTLRVPRNQPNARWGQGTSSSSPRNKQNARWCRGTTAPSREASSSCFTAARMLLGAKTPSTNRTNSKKTERLSAFKREMILDNRSSFDDLLEKMRRREQQQGREHGATAAMSTASSDEECSDLFDLLSNELDKLQGKPLGTASDIMRPTENRASMTRTVSSNF